MHAEDFQYSDFDLDSDLDLSMTLGAEIHEHRIVLHSPNELDNSQNGDRCLLPDYYYQYHKDVTLLAKCASVTNMIKTRNQTQHGISALHNK